MGVISHNWIIIHHFEMNLEQIVLSWDEIGDYVDVMGSLMW